MCRAIAVPLCALAIAAAVGAAVRAQNDFRRPSGRVSPHESVSATVGGAKLAIVYGRPSMRGRTIFGSLVPFGRVWCPGADEATTLESTKELLIGNLQIPAGPHTIWMLPTADHWRLVVSQDPSGFHTQYHPDRDLGRIDLRRRELSSPVEQLTFTIAGEGSGRGSITMAWEKTEVSTPFTVVN
jgi:hypothetical protein